MRKEDDSFIFTYREHEYKLKKEWVYGCDEENKGILIYPGKTKEAENFLAGAVTNSRYENFKLNNVEIYFNGRTVDRINDMSKKIENKEVSAEEIKELETRIKSAGCEICKEDENGYFVKRDKFVGYIPKDFLSSSDNEKNKGSRISGIFCNEGVPEVYYEKYGIGKRSIAFQELNVGKYSYDSKENVVSFICGGKGYEVPAAKIIIEDNKFYIRESELKKYDFKEIGNKNFKIYDNNITKTLGQMVAAKVMQQGKEKQIAAMEWAV